MRPTILLILGLLAICVELPGQISKTLRALTPITATAISGSVVHAPGQPVGTLLDYGNVAASALGTNAFVSWSGGTSTRESTTTLRHELSVPTNSGGTSLTLIGTEILIEYTAPVPTPVYLEISIEMQMPAGATAPSLNVDINNNGIIDVSSGNPSGGGIFVIGTQPFAVRLQSTANFSLDGDMIASIHVNVTPRNQLSIYTAATGCLAPGLSVAPSFLGTGLVAEQRMPHNAPSVLVLGLQMQPILLSSANPLTSLPCLLIPRPDFTVAMVNSNYELAIPAAVRPINIYAQRVGFYFGGLFTSPGYFINAQ